MAPVRLASFATALLLSVFNPLLSAQQFVPASDDFIVEKLPSAIVTLSQELADNRALDDKKQSSSTPSAIELSTIEQQALAAYRIAASSQDQRAYGHTLAVLKRWPEEQEKSLIIHILLAAVLQHEHSFNEALSHLDAALIKDPANAQVWLMRAQINLVIADYDSARESCDALRTMVRPAVSINCMVQVDALTGNAQRSLDVVESLLQDNRDLSMQDYSELFTSAASFAQLLGKTEEALRYYETSLQITPDHPYLLVHYGQLLLEQARYDDAIALFALRDERTLPDEQKILYSRALLMSEEPQRIDHANALRDSLAEGFDSAFKRDEALPNKAFAQFALYISKEPEKALAAARENWSLQKEPSDTLLLALAAEANDAQAVLTDLARWADAHDTEDVRLDRVFADNEVVR